MANAQVVRYSDDELEEFRQVVMERYQKAKEELDDLRSQILEISESLEGDFGTDYMDDSSVVNDLEMLNNMAIRKRKYLQDLENAMIRIKNKTYGICTVTGELIDKKRLMAVPTTTKSVQGKTMLTGGFTENPATLEEEEDEEEKPKKKAPREPKIITRVIRKNSAGEKARPAVEEDEEEDVFADEELFGSMKRVSPEDVVDDVEDTTDDDDDEGSFGDEPYDEGDDSEED